VIDWKLVSKMASNVLMGTLNPTNSLTTAAREARGGGGGSLACAKQPLDRLPCKYNELCRLKRKLVDRDICEAKHLQEQQRKDSKEQYVPFKISTSLCEWPNFDTNAKSVKLWPNIFAESRVTTEKLHLLPMEVVAVPTRTPARSPPPAH